MDIRVINSNRKIVNVSRLSLEAQGRYVVGLTDDQKQVLVEICSDEREAEILMEKIIECIKKAHKNNEKDILIDITCIDFEELARSIKEGRYGK